MEKLYHVSPIANLDILQPKISTHGKAYVYATKDLDFALLFGSQKSYGDFDGIYGVNNGKPFFYEAYKGAFERRFKGETCYIYEVDPTNFIEGKTSFTHEFVSEVPVKILSSTKIEDLYVYLQEQIANGKLDFHKFSTNKNYQNEIKEHIRERIETWEVYKKPNSRSYKICQEQFPKLLKAIEEHCEKNWNAR